MLQSPQFQNLPPELLQLLMSAMSLQKPPTVATAMEGKQTPWQQAQQEADKSYLSQGSRRYEGDITGQYLKPGETTTEDLDVEEPEEPEAPPEDGGGEEAPKKKGMTVAEAMTLLGAGAGATGGMMPRAPGAPGLPGAGRFSPIDPTTLMFLRSLGAGRR